MPGSETPSLPSSMVSPQISASSSGTNPGTPHHSGGRVRKAASKLKHKLGFKSHKHHNESVAETSPAPPPLDTRASLHLDPHVVFCAFALSCVSVWLQEAAGTSTNQILSPAANTNADVAVQPTACDSQPADFQWLCHRDIFVQARIATHSMLRLVLGSSLVDQLLAPMQVLHASKLRGADMGGSSDPVCKVSFGPFKAHTRVLKHTLDPEWNETFIFVLEPDALAVMGSVPMLSFEVWDHNNFAPNYFLGEVRCRSAC